MTLTTHGIIGAATASLFPAQYYPLAWSASFISHFFADAIPHWDYSIASSEKAPKNKLERDFLINRESIPDLIKIGCDFSLGLLIGYLLFPGHLFNPWLILGGAFFGILPDPLQFAYWKIRRQPLTTLQKIHISIHAKRKLSAWPTGIPFQLSIIALTFIATFLFSSFLNTIRLPV